MRQYRLGLAKWEPPSTAEMAEGCIRNAEEAAVLESAARRKFDALPVGDEQLAGLRLDMRRYRLEQEHWRAMARHFDAQRVEEQRQASAAAARVAEQRRRETETPHAAPEPGANDLAPWELEELGVRQTADPEPRWDRGAPT